MRKLWCAIFDLPYCDHEWSMWMDFDHRVNQYGNIKLTQERACLKCGKTLLRCEETR